MLYGIKIQRPILIKLVTTKLLGEITIPVFIVGEKRVWYPNFLGEISAQC